MKEITLGNACRLTSPNSVTVVCTEKPDGTANLATVSWWQYLSFHPDMICFAMARTSYTGEMVRENKKVTVTVPGADIASEVMSCGMATGRDTDKVQKFGIELQALPDSSIKIPLHSRVAIQCHLKEFYETGDHYLYICNVDKVYGDAKEEALFAWKGYSSLRPAK